MAFTLKIKQNKLLRGKPLTIPGLAAECGLSFGSYGDFYILQPGEQDGTAILYNPKRIGRGIFLDVRQGGQGLYEMSYLIPTTAAELGDFARLAALVEEKLGGERRVEMYCPEEERSYTARDLAEQQGAFADFSRETLGRFCGDGEYENLFLTLALWPYTLTAEQKERWREQPDLAELEQVIHEAQSRDLYFAKPRLMQKSSGEIGAFYVLTEDCESVFPDKADGFLHFDRLEIAEGFVRFFIYSENRALDGMYPYERFIEEVRRFGALPFDGSHLLIPPLNKAQLLELVERISGE